MRPGELGKRMKDMEFLLGAIKVSVMMIVAQSQESIKTYWIVTLDEL
jgi:hypothetical protein